MRIIPALGLRSEMTARHVTSADVIERRMLAFRPLPRIRATLAKATAMRPVGWCRNGSWNDVEPLLIVADVRHRVHQAFGVGVVRPSEELGDGRLLDDLARVHHDDPRSSLGDY